MYLKRSFFIRTISAIVIVFGVSGLILSAIGLVQLNRYFPSKAGTLASDISLNESIDSATGLMEDTSIVLKNASLTLDQIEKSLTNSQKLLQNTSKAFFDIAETVNFEILGYRPLEKSYKYFINIGDSLSVLSSDIEATGKHLNTNSRDLVKTSESMDAAAKNINKVYSNFSESLTKIAGYGINSLLKCLLVYIIVLHLIFILIGLAMILK